MSNEGIFRGYGPDDVKTFLEENGVIESVVSKLFEEQVTGHMLIDLSEEDLKDALGSLLHARNIKTKVKNFIGVSSEQNHRDKTISQGHHRENA